MSSWREQESETQVRSRVANESTARADAAGHDAGGVSSFRCECGDRDCTCAIQLTLMEYEAVRADDTHFAIARNHENPERELIEENQRFAVVETVSGEALKHARRTGRNSKLGGDGGPGPESPPARPEVAGAGGSSTRVPRPGIELLNGHWHESPGAHGPQGHICPACDVAITAGDGAVHLGGELYHPGCTGREGPA